MSLILKRSFVIRQLNCVQNIKHINRTISYKHDKRKRLLINGAEVLNNKRNIQLLENHVWHFHTSSPNFKVIPFRLSDIGEGIREVTIKEWFVSVGDEIRQFENVCEVQSDKATATITSRYDGIVRQLYYRINDVALVGQPLIDIEIHEDDDEPPLAAETEPEVYEKEPEESDPNKKQETSTLKVLTTPAVRRIASQHNLNLSDVKATGKNGRVLKEDVLSFLNLTSDESNKVIEKPKELRPAPLNVLLDKKVPIDGFQRAMVKTMTTSLKIPHFVLSDEYNFTKLVHLRGKLKRIAEIEGVKLTFMPIIIKSVSMALLKFPILNSTVDEACENINYKATHNIGFAMDTPNGLIVPNIKNVQEKSIFEIAKELNRLQELGAKGTLSVNDITGGTFTVSNIGNIGGTYTKPVILAPQVCIVAFGKARPTPQFDEDGKVVRADMTAVSWSADHRIIDGATMARFSNTVKTYLENPEQFILFL